MNIWIGARASCYAKAVVQTLEKQAGATQAIESAMHGLRDFWHTYQESQLLREVLGNPRFRRQRQVLLQQVFAKLAAPPIAMHVTDILANRHALALLPQIIAEMQNMMDVRLGRVRAVMTCAVALNPEQTQRLAESLQRQLQKPVVMVVEEDPHLLGGMICQIGNMTFDGSLKGRLTLMAEQLTTHLAPNHTR